MDMLETVNEIRKEKDDVDFFLDFLKVNSEVLIYGTGLAAMLICDFVSNYTTARVTAFVDIKANRIYRGLPVLDLNSIEEKSAVIIAANPNYNIQERLIKAGIENYITIDPFVICSYEKDNDFREKNYKTFIRDYEKIKHARSKLSDLTSIQVFDMAITQRIHPMLKEVTKLQNDNQYFGNDIVKEPPLKFADLGAFDGDTLRRYLDFHLDDRFCYYAVEAEERNCNSIQDFCRKNSIAGVNIINCAAWECKDTLSFKPNAEDEESSFGAISDSGQVVLQADALDNILNNKEIEMITMDIEGAELKALRGAKNTIKNNKPILAISIYHEFEHIYECLLYISQIRSDYKFYLRHHRWNIADTVLYCI